MQIGYSRDWWHTLAALEGNESRAVSTSVALFCDNPNHPGLNFEFLHGDRRLRSIRASISVRILLAVEGNVAVFLEAGQHDALYRRAERMRFVANPATGFVGLVPLHVDEQSQLPVRAPEQPLPDAGPRVMDHWSDAELLEVGFSPEEVVAIRTCDNEDDLCVALADIERLELLMNVMELTPEQYRNRANLRPEDSEERIRRAILNAPNEFSRLFPPEEALQIAMAPIEDWMVFLHPDQRAAVDRRYSGPARVRGSAGTGKTVVALHRAADLAQRFRDEGEATPILFTTYIRSLPPVLKNLFGRMPNTEGLNVEFINIDKLAMAICRDAGRPPVVDPARADAAFASAYKAVVLDGTPLSGLSRQYLRDEVDAVIKGRGVRTFGGYLGVERVGRTTPFTEPMRRQAWALHERFGEELSRRGVVGFPDVVLGAREIAASMSKPMYRAAIIDEAQDLSLVALQLVRLLVNGPGGVDRPDNIFIAGDGAQRIYAGGFTLAQAGLDLRGRTTVLRANYRNTRQILSAALAVAGSETVNDLGDIQRRDEAAAEALRDGQLPTLKVCTSHVDELDFVVRQIRALTADGAMGLGDFAVAVASNQQVREVTERLASEGLATRSLEHYEGVPAPEVKVGTHHRIKGLEFKVVLLPFLGAADFPRPISPGQDELEYREQSVRMVAHLYVAMTRARDALFLTCTGDASPVLERALESFELL